MTEAAIKFCKKHLKDCGEYTNKRDIDAPQKRHFLRMKVSKQKIAIHDLCKQMEQWKKVEKSFVDFRTKAEYMKK